MSTEIKYTYAIHGINFDILSLSLKIAKEWDEEVQPIIDAIGGRSDVGWSWKKWYALSYIFNLLGQNAQGYAVYYRDLPVGMFFGVFSYSCKDKDKKIWVPSFLWLISKNPELDTILDELEEKNGIRPKIYFTEMIFDIITKEGKRLNNKQSFWLHASPDGENPEKLLNFYKRKGLEICKISRPTIVRRDDGRYLYYPEDKVSNIQKAIVSKGDEVYE